ncbi:MAG TPA: hypothetical protein ENJ09_15355 [Planctomycetes bacterium]|nr:hypothetical protein [Planctomycetota bacterium]
MIEFDEAAKLLDVPAWTLRRWVRQGLVAPEADGEHFDRERLLAWARRHGLAAAPGPSRPAAPPPDLLADAVAGGAFLDAASAMTASKAIARLVHAHPGIAHDSRAELLEDILERERQASTALGNGIALPHPRRAPRRWVKEPSISILRPTEAIDWAALDGRPVVLVLLPLAPEISTHLELLSRLSFALGVPGTIERLLEAPDQEAACSLLREIQMKR